MSEAGDMQFGDIVDTGDFGWLPTRPGLRSGCVLHEVPPIHQVRERPRTGKSAVLFSGRPDQGPPAVAQEKHRKNSGASALELVAEAGQVDGVPTGATEMCALRRESGMQDLYAPRFEELDQRNEVLVR